MRECKCVSSMAWRGVQGATAFLGTQGDPWDTQWDMFLALVGAMTALLTLSAVHERQLHNLTARE